jgi:transcriptional regulator with XRE-family HTH domain
METLEILGKNLKLLREERKVRQTDLAELLNITPRHYQKIEYGKVNLPTLTLCTLADYYGVTTDYLLGRSDVR